MSIIEKVVGIVSPPAGLALKALGWLKGSLGYMAKHWQLTLAVAACLVAAWALHGKAGAIKRADREHAANAALIQASNTARAKAIAQKADLERKSKEQADAADKLRNQLAADHAGLDAAIRDGRMRYQALANRSGTVAAASGDASPVSPDAPADPVVVDASGLTVCKADYDYAFSAYSWAKSQFGSE